MPFLALKGISIIWTIMVISTLIRVIHSASRQRFVQEYFMNRKFNCAGKRILTATSQMQCVHQCLRNEQCEIANYREGESGNIEQDNCKVFDVRSYHQSCSSTAETGWKALILTRKTELKPKVYKSCKEIKQNLPNATSGIYDLKDGRHICKMGDIVECGPGGWTLAMKIDGTKHTFRADKELWENDAVFNINNGSKSFYTEEAKFHAFSKVSFESMCIGMTHSGTTKWLRINKGGSSLQDIFKNGTYIATSFSRGTWKSLIHGSSLNYNCNREGINVQNSVGKIFVRIGLAANNENNCESPDSFIGLGIVNLTPCSSLLEISCGNFATCSTDNGEKSLPAMGFILIQ